MKTNMSSIPTRGKITRWNDKRGFGFITPNSGGKEVFIHIKSFAKRDRRPEIGQVVTYTLSRDKQGRPCAVKASFVGSATRSASKKSESTYIAKEAWGGRETRNARNKPERNNASGAFLSALIFLALVGIAIFLGKIPPWIFILYSAVSLLTFVVYARDKSAAKNGAWRTPESTLHFLALAGGWPGALIAQQELRHKSKKQSFRLVFGVTVLLNCGALLWLAIYSSGA